MPETSSPRSTDGWRAPPSAPASISSRTASSRGGRMSGTPTSMRRSRVPAAPLCDASSRCGARPSARGRRRRADLSGQSHRMPTGTPRCSAAGIRSRAPCQLRTAACAIRSQPVDIPRHHLFAEDVFAGIKAADGDVRMLPERHGDEDRFHVLLLEQFGPLRVVTRFRQTLLLHRLVGTHQRCGIDVADARTSPKAGSTLLSSARPWPPTPITPSRTGPPGTGPLVVAAAARSPRAGVPARAFKNVRRPSSCCSGVRYMSSLPPTGTDRDATVS